MGCEPDRSYKSRIDMLKIAQTRSQIAFYWFVHLCFDTFIEATKPRELGHRKLGGKKACFSDRPNTEHDKSAHNYLQKKSESDEVNLSVNLHQYTLDDWDTQSNMSGSSSIWMWWRLQELSIHLSPTPELVPAEESHVSYRVLNTPFLWCHRCGFIFYETMVHGVWY